MTDALKPEPCPFCNGSPDSDQPNLGHYVIYCKDCGATIGDDDPDRALAAWNRRAARSQPSALTEGDKLPERIAAYLSMGGLWNPELADHVAVRDLLIECRAILSAAGSRSSDAELREAASEVLRHRDGTQPIRGWLRDNDHSRTALTRLDAALRSQPMGRGK